MYLHPNAAKVFDRLKWLMREKGDNTHSGRGLKWKVTLPNECFLFLQQSQLYSDASLRGLSFRLQFGKIVSTVHLFQAIKEFEVDLASTFHGCLIGLDAVMMSALWSCLFIMNVDSVWERDRLVLSLEPSDMHMFPLKPVPDVARLKSRSSDWLVWMYVGFPHTA